MISKTNIEHQLLKARCNRISEESLLKEVALILTENQTANIRKTTNPEKLEKPLAQSFDLNLLERNQIYHISDIKKICIDYRLRFLDAHYFRGTIPEEATSKIRNLEKDHDISLNTFKIMAPSKLLKLENADDPLLFSPLGGDYYYLIHKWGNDLHPLRKLLMWPYKSFENLIFLIFVLSIVMTLITPIGLFSKANGMQEHLLIFLFFFKGIAGIALFYGFAKGKNFNGAIWRSRFYNA